VTTLQAPTDGTAPAAEPEHQLRDYTVHLSVSAVDDEAALLLAEQMHGAVATAVPGYDTERPVFVTDTGDWAEHVTTTCQAHALALPDPDVHNGPPSAVGVGRRLCPQHAAAYDVCRGDITAVDLTSEPVRSLTAAELDIDGDDGVWAGSVEDAIGLKALHDAAGVPL